MHDGPQGKMVLIEDGQMLRGHCSFNIYVLSWWRAYHKLDIQIVLVAYMVFKTLAKILLHNICLSKCDDWKGKTLGRELILLSRGSSALHVISFIA